MSDNQSSQPISYHDDNRVMRYLLHNVRGISAVSGGVMGDALENEYLEAESEGLPSEQLDFDGEF